MIDKADLAQELYIERVMDLDYKADLAQRIEKVIDKADLAQEQSSHLLRSSPGVLRFCQ